MQNFESRQFISNGTSVKRKSQMIFRRLSHNCPQFASGNSEVKLLFSSSRWKPQDQIARVGASENFACPKLCIRIHRDAALTTLCRAEGQSYCSYSQFCEFSQPRKLFFCNLLTCKIHELATGFSALKTPGSIRAYRMVHQVVKDR
jgi:hypothetical protein